MSPDAFGPDVAQAATEHAGGRAFSIREAARIVEGLSTPIAWIYWLDLLITAAVAHGSIAAMIFAPLPLWGRAVFFVIGLFGVYRGAMFNHELSHLSRKGFGAFRLAWNILFGIPFLMPSFLYDEHRAHHGHHTYGSERDGEYLPLAGRPREILLYLLEPVYYPILYFLRFLAVFPLSFIHPRLRQWVLERASTMVIVLDYRRDLPPAAERWWWFWEELACSAFAWGFVWLILMKWPWYTLPTVYALSVCALTMNAVRTLAAHRFRRYRQATSHVEQLLDSVSIPGGLWTELWAPVGLRYHALHHLFPSIPYHSVGTAHRRLMAQLPADSPYRETVSPSLWRTLVTLWNDRRATSEVVESRPLSRMA